jgi:hypothetical protein
MAEKRVVQNAAADAPTLVDGPATRRRRPRDARRATVAAEPASQNANGSGARTTSGASEHAIARALRDEEQVRAHAFSGVAALMSLSSLCSLPLVGGNAVAKLLAEIAVALIVLASLLTWRLTRRGTRPERNVMRAYGFTLVSCALVLLHYVGFFSAGIVIMPVGIYYFGQSSDRVQNVVIPAFLCAGYLGAALLVAGNVLPDLALISAPASLDTRLVALSQATFVLALTARMATLARRSMRAAMTQSHEAMSLARTGEALLAEAQQQLERALGIVVGQASHYSGQIAGRYQLGVVIGIGAMGEVYAAEHVDTGQPAAVKLMRPSALARADLVERFLREGEICASLHSPHLVTIHEVGRLEDGAPYMAMEMLRGQDLAARLRKDGRLPSSDVLELGRALAAGLAVVHDAGNDHRDLKPLNVFQAEQDSGLPCWKILDFGISKPRASTGTLTEIGVLGTPGYMSPEQARGKPLDHRSDVFAMGALLYRALTGRPAFIGNDSPQIMFEIAYKMPEQPSLVREGLPSGVDCVFGARARQGSEQALRVGPRICRRVRARAE